MKKFSAIFIVLLLGLFITACGSTTVTNSSDETYNLEGLWVYEGPTDQDPSYIVNLTINPDNEFSLEINNNAQEGEATSNTSNIEGNYTDEDGNLTLTVSSFEDKNSILTDVTENSKLDLTYEFSEDGTLELNNLSNYVKDLPSSIELVKSNQ